jgi:hypothetical protein
MLRRAYNQRESDAVLAVWHAKQECLLASGADTQRRPD